MPREKGPFQDIVDLARAFKGLQEKAYAAYKPVVERLLDEQSGDTNAIEHTLDGLLDFCDDGKMTLLFQRLNRHYATIDPEAAADYESYLAERKNTSSPER